MDGTAQARARDFWNKVKEGACWKPGSDGNKAASWVVQDLLFRFPGLFVPIF